MFLHCDESATTPVATTQGDSQVILNYVRSKLYMCCHALYQHQSATKTVSCLLQVFDITAREVCPGKGGGGGGGAGGVAPGELGLVIIFV